MIIVGYFNMLLLVTYRADKNKIKQNKKNQPTTTATKPSKNTKELSSITHCI